MEAPVVWRTLGCVPNTYAANSIAVGQPVFVKACPLAKVPAGGTLGLKIDGEPVCLIRTGGEVFALRDMCSHADVPLSDGEVNGNAVQCWLHGSCFDVRTGEPTEAPAWEPVPVYPVKVEGDDVYVALSMSAEKES
jgi:3-phenylpropionate/trans-cinnamate dioxygenase ferredoxin subunit